MTRAMKFMATSAIDQCALWSTMGSLSNLYMENLQLQIDAISDFPPLDMNSRQYFNNSCQEDVNSIHYNAIIMND